MSTSSWLKNNAMLNGDWTTEGKCGEHEHLPWCEDQKPDHSERVLMEEICDQCPVILKCADYALHSGNGRGVDGGFHAGVWIPWPSPGEGKSTTLARTQARRQLRRILKPLAEVLPMNVNLCTGSGGVPGNKRPGAQRAGRYIDRGYCAACDRYVSTRRDGMLRRHGR